MTSWVRYVGYTGSDVFASDLRRGRSCDDDAGSRQASAVAADAISTASGKR